MYTAADLSNAIRNLAKTKNIRMRDMLDACSLNINAISQISDKKGISCFALAHIADYLNCSVDYLLGRTDSPGIASAAQPADAQYEPEAAALFSRILLLDEPDRARISERVDILLEDDKYSAQDAASLPA